MPFLLFLLNVVPACRSCMSLLFAETDLVVGVAFVAS